MKKKANELSSMAIGSLLMIGLLALPVLFLGGAAWLIRIGHPLLFWFSEVTFTFTLLILLPLSIFKKARRFSGEGFVIASYILGITTWVWAFQLAYFFWGRQILLTPSVGLEGEITLLLKPIVQIHAAPKRVETVIGNHHECRIFVITSPHGFSDQFVHALIQLVNCI